MCTKAKKEKKDRAAKEEEEEEEGMVPSKDPLRKPGVESNHQPFDLESNALPLALPGLAHANCRTISTKNPFFNSYFYSVPFTSQVWVRGSWSRCWRRGYSMGLQGGEGRHCSRVRNVGRASRGRAKGALGDPRYSS